MHISKDVLSPKKIAEEYETAGRGADLPHWVPDSTDFLFMYNTPQLINEHILDSKVRIITNFRDPRDLLCNQFHWVFQHPMLGKTEEEMETRRRFVREQGINEFVKRADVRPLYTSLKKIEGRLNSDDKDILILSYRQLCTEFDLLVDRICQFFRVNREDIEPEPIELERTTNLEKNPEWIGQSWSGTDIMPGRYLNELSAECISYLNEKYAEELALIERLDPPRTTTPSLIESDGLCRQVLFGKNEKLFLKHDSNRVVDQITGHMKLGLGTCVNIAQTHAARRRFGATIGNFQYHHAIAPMKEVACRRDLPDSLKYEAFGQRPILQFLSVASSIWRPFYEPAILEDDENTSFYPQRDTHWNHEGAFRYLRAFIATSAPELLSRLDALAVQRFMAHQPSDLGSRLNEPDDEVQVVDPTGVPFEFIFDNRIGNEGRIRVSRNASGRGRAVIFQDSFGNWLWNFFASLFSEVTFFHGTIFDYEMVLSLRPNYVFCLQAERFLPRVPENGVSAMKFIEWQEKEKRSPRPYGEWLKTL
ncbi:sulfotransferase domain-containing protein [Xanthobacter autotrophicus]|uniref:sulfotransferase domain-containing protein n=1 Tax=Xanthobacter autotrophicus TaxID=280 RepID=UPI0037294411